MRGSLFSALIMLHDGLKVYIFFMCFSILSTTAWASSSAEFAAEYRIFRYSQRNRVVIVLNTTSLL